MNEHNNERTTINDSRTWKDKVATKMFQKMGTKWNEMLLQSYIISPKNHCNLTVFVTDINQKLFGNSFIRYTNNQSWLLQPITVTNFTVILSTTMSQMNKNLSTFVNVTDHIYIYWKNFIKCDTDFTSNFYPVTNNNIGIIFF